MSNFEPVSLPLSCRNPPPGGEIDLWICQLSDFPLGPAIESGHGKSYRQAMRFRQRFVLRLLLGSYLNCPGKALRFGREPGGKPRLAALDQDAPGLEFNVSHSGDWMALAVARDFPVGVDIEVGRELKRASALARRALSATEADWIRALSEPDRSLAFFGLWTRREALVKAMGASLFSNLKNLELEARTGDPKRLPESWPALTRWSLEQPDLSNGLIVAVAAPRPDASIRCFDLDCRANGVRKRD